MLKKLIRIIPLILIVLLSLIVGTADISVGSIVTGDMDALFIFGSSRIPRTVSVFLAGSGLALSGMVMQTSTQNRFAAPDTIGTVESAKLGMVLAMIVLPNMTQMWEMLFTFAFATIGTVFFLFLTSRFPMKKQLLIPLLGLMFGNIVGGFSNFLAFRYDLNQNIAAWLQGNFSLIIQGQYELIYFALILVIGLYFFADYLTVVRMGEDAAQSLGISFKWVVGSASLLVSVTVAVILITAGSLPFLGVIIPNIIAMKYGDNIKKTHQKVALTGGFFLLICDIIARSLIAPYEVPVQLILGIIAGAIFLYLLFKEVRRV